MIFWPSSLSRVLGLTALLPHLACGFVCLFVCFFITWLRLASNSSLPFTCWHLRHGSPCPQLNPLPIIYVTYKRMHNAYVCGSKSNYYKGGFHGSGGRALPSAFALPRNLTLSLPLLELMTLGQWIVMSLLSLIWGTFLPICSSLDNMSFPYW